MNITHSMSIVQDKLSLNTTSFIVGFIIGGILIGFIWYFHSRNKLKRRNLYYLRNLTHEARKGLRDSEKSLVALDELFKQLEEVNK